MKMSQEDLLQRALMVYRNLPDWDDSPSLIYLRREQCLLAVGVDEESASSEALRRQFNRMIQGADERHGRSMQENSYDANVQRAVALCQLVVVRPDTMKKATVAWTMQLAGFPPQECAAGKAYMKVSRDLARIKKGKQLQGGGQTHPAAPPRPPSQKKPPPQLPHPTT